MLQIQPYNEFNVVVLFSLLILSTVIAMMAFAFVSPIEVGLSRVTEPLVLVGLYIIALVTAFLISDSMYQWGVFFGIFLPTTYTLAIVPFDATELIPSNRILLLVGYAATRGLILLVYLYMMGMIVI